MNEENTEYLRKNIKYSDILIWVSFSLMLAVKFCTIFLFVQVHQDTGAEIESVATAYEANQVFKMAYSLNHIGLILTMIVLPAGLIAFYYYMRRKVLLKKVDIHSLLFFTQFAFFSLLINIVNDGAALLSKLA